MRLRVPIPSTITTNTTTDSIIITDSEIHITDIDASLDTTTIESSGVLHAAYEYLTDTTNTITETELSSIQTYIADGPTPIIDYENEYSEWVPVTNPAFIPRDPITESNSPFTHGDVIATPNQHRFRFTGWQHERPTFTRAGTPIGAQHHRIELSNSDALIGNNTDTKTLDDLFTPNP